MTPAWRHAALCGLVLVAGAAAMGARGDEPPAHGGHVHAAMPQQAGQAAFAAIAEIVALLEADPATDWSRVDIGALRQHLVDMDEVILHASAEERPVDGGLEILVTGEGRTRVAIERMLPAHARELDAMDGWSAEAVPGEAGVTLRVTSPDAGETARIRGLGFFGLMATGAHHQRHHLAIATGQTVHGH